ncbi:enoyl-CoA hydratase [Solimonas terrae]|uniref:Enoyl-CoA hydratase n=1 Tax=Solimonas terrae TaxID=1396819 RepID=A0A6M2BN52_9GAMM|nr:enoyl-CoA hydratase [Solimonas terrae]NGY03661.1 enoyl-CoA hydratase [Solimonas terrae]
MSTEPIVTEVRDRILTIRLNRADKKNAINGVMYKAMADAMIAGNADPEVRVILFTGTDGCFSSGNDLADFLNSPMDAGGGVVAQFMQSVVDAGKPVVAAVAGPAVGIGTTLLLHCDLIYAAEKTRFQLPFVNIGICPEFASSLMMPVIMGHPRAAELLLLGEPFTAAKAREYGLINEVLPEADVEAHARAQALKLAAQPPNAMRTAKALLKRWTREQVKDVIGIEVNHFVPMLQQPEAIEAIGAFVQKRKPDFSKFN